MIAPFPSAPLLTWLDATPPSRSLVGGKGHSLSQLAALGAPVPPAFALTTEAYDLFARSLALPPVASASDIEALTGIQEQLRQEPLPPALSLELAEAYAAFRRRCGAVPLAVRSSAPAEDSAEASFAGVHDTFLDIHSLPDLESAVRRCWASLWSERAVSYRLLRGMNAQPSTIAVVVQQMIPSDVSFVVFTSDPVTHRAGHLVISASWGLGEAVVSGLVTPDHIVVGPDDEIVEYVVGRKAIMVIPGASPDDGPREVPVPRALQDLPVLTTPQILSMSRLAREISTKLGFEADLEGAVAADRLYLFQARPITTSTSAAASAIAAPIQA